MRGFENKITKPQMINKPDMKPEDNARISGLSQSKSSTNTTHENETELFAMLASFFLF
jgi:hypothetical protein